MNKPENKAQDVPLNERAQVLGGMCYKTDMQNVRRNYTPEQKREIKETIVQESLTNRTKKAEFDIIAKEFNKVYKDNGKKIGQNLDDLKRGYSENDEQVYLFDDQERGMMDAYDADGNYLSSRPLYKDEQQTKILEMNTGTNG